MGEYRAFSEYEKDIRIFYNYFTLNGPQNENKQVILLELLQKSLSEGANMFLRAIN